MSAASPPLEYAPPPPKRRKVIRRLVLLLLLLSVAAPAVYHRKRIWHQGRVLYWQHKCLTYTAPVDQVVYDEDDYNISPLLKRAGYRGWPVPHPPNAGAPVAPLPPAIATFAAPPLAPFIQTGVLPGWLAPPAGATVFLHERTSKTGHRRLVLILRAPVHDAPFMHAFGLNAIVITPAGLTTRPKYPDPPMVAFSWIGNLTRPPTTGLRFYAGQPDPRDDSRFTIRYDLSGGTGEIEGKLKDDGKTVSLQITSGPAIGTKWQTDVLFKD